MAQKLDRFTFESILNEEIVSFSVKNGSNKGDGVAGSLRSITIRTKSGKQHSLVIKLLPIDNVDILCFLVQCRVMDSENEIYRSILPNLKAILTAKNINPELLPFAKHYDGTADYVILEDLRPEGYKMADKFEGLNFPQASLVLSAIANFHATSHFYIRQEGEKIFSANDIRPHLLHFPWNPKGMDPKYFKDTVSMYIPMVEIMKRKDEGLGQKLANLIPQFQPLFSGIFDKTDKKYFPVLCHGDLWINNMLFKHGETGPNSVKFIDLQLVHRGNIFEELVYFFGTSTTPEFREEYLLKSLEVYYRSFTSMLLKLNCPLPIGFTLGFLIDEYYANLKTWAAFCGPAIAMQLGGVTDPSTPEVKDDESEDAILIEDINVEELPPAGSNYTPLGDFCKESILAEPRALQRFYNNIYELDRLGVLDS